MTARAIVDNLLETGIDDPGELLPSYVKQVASDDDAATARRWVLVKEKHNPDGSSSALYQNPETLVAFKVSRLTTDDTDVDVYVYDPSGHFVDGDVGEIPTVAGADLKACLSFADAIVKRLIKDWSTRYYRKIYQ